MHLSPFIAPGCNSCWDFPLYWNCLDSLVFIQRSHLLLTDHPAKMFQNRILHIVFSQWTEAPCVCVLESIWVPIQMSVDKTFFGGERRVQSLFFLAPNLRSGQMPPLHYSYEGDMLTFVSESHCCKSDKFTPLASLYIRYYVLNLFQSSVLFAYI